MNPLKISEFLYRHYESVANVEAYYGLLAVWALCETAVEAKDEALLDECRRYLALYPDAFEHPKYHFEKRPAQYITFFTFTGPYSDKKHFKNASK